MAVASRPFLLITGCLIEDNAPFRATLKTPGQSQPVQSIAVRDSHVGCFAPRAMAADAELILERYAAISQHVSGAVRFLSPQPQIQKSRTASPQR